MVNFGEFGRREWIIEGVVVLKRERRVDGSHIRWRGNGYLKIVMIRTLINLNAKYFIK